MPSTQAVCAHMNLGPYSNHQFYSYSIQEAVAHFAESLEARYGSMVGIIDTVGEDHTPCIDLYYIDSRTMRTEHGCQCNDRMNFHDYPSARWVVGNRGGVRKVPV